MSEQNVIKDLTREVSKALDVMQRVDVMMAAEAQMNAAKHMSDNVMPNPLAAAVAQAVVSLKFAENRGERALQGELPLTSDAERSTVVSTFGGEKEVAE